MKPYLRPYVPNDNDLTFEIADADRLSDPARPSPPMSRLATTVVPPHLS